MSKKKTAQERRDRIAKMREHDARQQRRRSLVIAAVTILIVVVIIGASVWAVQTGANDSAASGTSQQIPGLQTFDGLSRNHVESTVDYPQIPPVGGDHAGVWQNCGEYAQPISNENVVHSLEHGAVWITYQPDLAANQIALLTAAAENQPYVLVSPYPGLPAPAVVSAWGEQVSLDGADDPRLTQFIQAFANGPQTPEPGAPCDGGIGEPQ